MKMIPSLTNPKLRDKSEDLTLVEKPFANRLIESLHQVFALTPPSWEAYESVAVNPFYGLKHLPFSQGIEEIGRATHRDLLPSADFFRQKLETGELNDSCIAKAIERNGQGGVPSVEDVKAWLSSDLSKQLPAPYCCLSDIYDDLEGASLTDFLRSRVSEWASAYFDQGQASWQMPSAEKGFYQAWKELSAHENSLSALGIKMGNFTRIIPENPLDAIEQMAHQFQQRLELTDQELLRYLQRLSFSCVGWASYFRKLDFEVERDNQQIFELESSQWLQFLAVRMIYDQVLLESLVPAAKARHYLIQTAGRSAGNAHHRLLLLEAVEIESQGELVRALATGSEPQGSIAAEAAKKYQFVFCIDVRSEVIRRHLEKNHQDLQTFGFAGFFGLPAKLRKAGDKTSFQACPVLLTPQLELEQRFRSAGAEHQFKAQQGLKSLTKVVQTSANTAFNYVESLGALFGVKLIGKAVADRRFEGRAATQRSDLLYNTLGLSVEEKAKLAKGFLKNSGLVGNLGECVVLAGHLSESANNPYASALDCGACAGHGGDSNAEIMAAILNDSLVRDRLRGTVFEIPETTLFVSAAHNTTTDHVHIYWPKEASDSMNYQEDLQAALQKSQLAAQRERAVGLAANAEERVEVLDFAERRAVDWSEIRPEWGLAKNASFIVGPRALSKNFNLEGRAFLHEYNCDADEDLSVLELILTAPMIVTNWINLQYYASTVAPDVFGSGDKILHNVTSGLGCVAGNGGDLLAGLSLQSTHKNGQYFHEPTRLQVIVQARPIDIDEILNRHEHVRQLVENQWLKLIAIPKGESVAKLRLAAGWLIL
jgi:uncharacterized protein YbcC (UPF0753/DUF2309 family)